ncbi:MAG TPA: dipeptide epimerase [Gemmatimonadaceae bacterium]|jgi:L-alanine-DL-glutamate epimerase-like enolase superfamily enzyme|nr:dipeptide epimerase [Gemmatimonadaceae bacterium]
MTLKVEHDVATVHTTHPFVIARGGATEHRLVRVRLIADDGCEGWGEAAPNRFYGETPDTALAALERLAPIVSAADPWHLEDVEAELHRALRYNGSVKSAVSAALHDLMGKRLGVPVYKLWGLDPTRAPLSSFTIAIAANDDELRKRVADAAPYPVLKVKLGTDHDERIIRTVRDAAPEKVLRVDANAAWTPKHALRMIDVLSECGVEYVEQPVAAHDLDGLRFVRERSRLPVIADESCVGPADVARLVGVADGINIKLSKCGGLREALKMIATARAHGMLVMAGCMIETSLGITAAAHFAPLLDYADYDGAALLSDDPYCGATIERGRIAIPDAAGLGVTRR